MHTCVIVIRIRRELFMIALNIISVYHRFRLQNLRTVFPLNMYVSDFLPFPNKHFPKFLKLFMNDGTYFSIVFTCYPLLWQKQFSRLNSQIADQQLLGHSIWHKTIIRTYILSYRLCACCKQVGKQSIGKGRESGRKKFSDRVQKGEKEIERARLWN